ncbi:hypothetical protein TNCV_4386831 [Trichonephila clavipes]|nr:hypothetical protein TNCV_4386831 [Trichonephila clavipes]
MNPGNWNNGQVTRMPSELWYPTLQTSTFCKCASLHGSSLVAPKDNKNNPGHKLMIPTTWLLLPYFISNCNV